MITINGKKYKINLDTKLGTRKMMKKIQENPEDPKNEDYIYDILKDLLVPKPANKQILEFRISDVEKVFKEFGKESEKLDTEIKKKLS